jgi:hypothetical protein
MLCKYTSSNKARINKLPPEKKSPCAVAAAIERLRGVINRPKWQMLLDDVRRTAHRKAA